MSISNKEENASMITDSMIFFGIDIDTNRLVHISQVTNREACDYFWILCGRSLIAKKRNVRIHHHCAHLNFLVVQED